MSSKPICEGPSSPMLTPTWVPTSLILDWLIAAMRMKSYARVKKAANVAAKGIFPQAAKPAAEPSMLCSAMKFSKKLLGNFLPNFSVYVEFLTSASSATTSGLTAPSASSATPNASRVATESPILYGGAGRGVIVGAAAEGADGRGITGAVPLG